MPRRESSSYPMKAPSNISAMYPNHPSKFHAPRISIFRDLSWCCAIRSTLARNFEPHNVRISRANSPVSACRLISDIVTSSPLVNGCLRGICRRSSPMSWRNSTHLDLTTNARTRTRARAGRLPPEDDGWAFYLNLLHGSNLVAQDRTGNLRGRAVSRSRRRSASRPRLDSRISKAAIAGAFRIVFTSSAAQSKGMISLAWTPPSVVRR